MQRINQPPSFNEKAQNPVKPGEQKNFTPSKLEPPSISGNSPHEPQ
jgi:hypothetical protein